MSGEEQHKPIKQPPYLDDSLLINTRLNEIERKQGEEKEEERQYKHRQLNFNRWMVIFTGLLFLTSLVTGIVLSIQTVATQKSADAATSAAKTANSALHTAERAYIITGLDRFNSTPGVFTISVVNSGHIPSGEVEAVTHEATFNSPNMAVPAEKHWGRAQLSPIPAGSPSIGIVVGSPLFNESQVRAARQVVQIAGILSYNDGFADDPIQQWSFCIQTPGVGIKSLGKAEMVPWIPCDPRVVIPRMEKADGYPNNEQKQ